MTSTASASPVDQRVEVLKVATGVGDLPGVSPEKPGGIPAQGPLSVAVESGSLYLWDQANVRVLVFAGAALARKTPLAPVRTTSIALVFQADRLYLRDQDDQGTPVAEDEFDATSGARLRTAQVSAGQPSLYPRERLTLPIVPNAPKGVGQRLGVDRYGNHYERFVPTTDCGACVEFRRIDASGAVIGRALASSGTRYEDISVSSDGAVYALAWDRDASNRIVGVTVVRLLTPAR